MVVTLDPGYERIYSDILKNVTNAMIVKVSMDKGWCQKYIFFLKVCLGSDVLSKFNRKCC
jgi:hypothetical protein